MDDGLGPISIEFIINNPEVLQQADAVEAALIGVSDSVNQQAAQTTAAIKKVADSFIYATGNADEMIGKFSIIGNTGLTALTGIDGLLAAINERFDQGIIDADQYKLEIAEIAIAQKAWSDAADVQTAALEKQAAILPSLRQELTDLKAELETATDNTPLAEIEAINLAIQKTEASITSFVNIGKIGYDEFGQKVKATSEAFEGQIGIINTLKADLAALKAENPSILDPQKLAQSNAQIELLEAQLAQAANAGKKGFDEMGNALPVAQTSKFEAALERSTNAGNIGARMVTQFTRQLVGLGVGFLSFEIGAKAVERLIGWVGQLDVFTGKLDQAKQNMAALTEVMKEADKEAGKDIGNLEILYKTATDVTKSTQERTQAANDLKDTYPQAFANSSAMAIMNGQEAASYKALTVEIYNAAKAQAAKAKIEQLVAQQLDAQFEIDQNNRKKAEAIRNIKPLTEDQIQAQNRSGGGAVSAKDQEAAIVNQTNFANQSAEETLKVSQGQIDFLMQYASGASKAGDALKKANEILGPDLQNFNNLLANAGDEAQLENVKKALQTKLDSLAPNDSQIAVIRTKLQQVDDLIKKSYQVKAGNPNADQDALKRRAALMQQIQQAEDSFQTKEMSKDQAALTGIENKYNDLRAKITAFNNDPKNANHKITDLSGLNKAENADVDNQANLNENEYIQQDIDKKKKLYADYDAYKIKMGADAANKEYADLLKSGQDFQTYLSNLQQSTKAQDDGSDAYKQRAAMVAKYQAEDAQNQKEHLDKLLEGLKSYDAQRSALTNSYQANYKQLVKSGHVTEAAELTNQYKQELGALDDANFEKLESVKELYSGITNMSAATAKKLIADVQAELAARIAAGTITAAEAKKVQDAIDKATKTLADGFPKELDAAGAALQKMGADLGKFNSGLGDAVTLVGQIASGMGKAVSDYNDFETAKNKEGGADTVGEITSGLGLISTLIGVVSAVVNFFKAASETAKASAAEMVAYQQSLITGQVKYNELLRDQERTQADITKMTLQQLEAQQQALQLQSQQAQADYTTLMSLIQTQGQQITGEHKTKYGGFLGIAQKTKVVQDLAGLSDTDFDQLQQLYTEGKLTDTTKAWFEQLQQVKQEMTDIGTSAADVMAAINQAATGTTADAITSAIVQGFQNGKRTAADFADDFNQMMNNALLSAFESNVLQGQIATFYQQFADASNSDGGLTPDKIAQLKAQYATIISNTATEVGQIEKITGTSVSSSGNSSSNTLQGAIQGMTEQQADLLAGQFGGLRITQLETNQILTVNMASSLAEMKNQTLVQMQIQMNTKRTADNTDQMKGDLKTIASNTSSSNLTNALRAAGK